MNGFEKTEIIKDFNKSLDAMKTACMSDPKMEAKFEINKTAQGKSSQAYSQQEVKHKSIANACHGLCEVLKRDLTLVSEGQKKINPKVKELLEDMSVKSLSIKACQLGNWEACTTYSVLSFEGLFGVEQDIPFGLKLAEKYVFIYLL